MYPYEATQRLCDTIQTGDEVSVDFDRNELTHKPTGKVIALKPLGDVRAVVDAGGLFNYARQTGMISK